MNVVDVIFLITNMQSAVSSLAAVDVNRTILQWEGDQPTPFFNRYWRVVTQAGQSPMFNARFLLADYELIRHESVTDFKILIAGYPRDDVEQMLIDEKLAFESVDYNHEGDAVISEVVLGDDDPRIAPTLESFVLYRKFWPETITLSDPDGVDVAVNRGRFSNHGV